MIPSESDCWTRLIARDYDEIAGQYEHLATARLYDRLIISSLPATRHVLVDLGCGTGALTQLLSRLADRVIGLDISAEMLRRAKTREYAGRVVFRRMPLDELSHVVGPGTCDAIVANRVLHHSKDLRSTVSMLTDTLVPGGHLIALDLYATGSRKGPWPIRAAIELGYGGSVLLQSAKTGQLRWAMRALCAESRIFASQPWREHLSHEPAFDCRELAEALEEQNLSVSSRSANVKFRLVVGIKRSD